MFEGTVRYEYVERPEDLFIKMLAKTHLIEIKAIYPILLNRYGDTIGSYVTITGWKPLVKFLEFLSGFTRKNKLAIMGSDF